MVRLTAKVHSDRKYLGTLVASDGREEGSEYKLCAQADTGLGVADPTLGEYKMLRVADVPEKQDALSAYGSHVLYFQASDGKILALHGGEADDEGRLRPTEGSLRLSNDDLGELVALLEGEEDVTLSIIEEDPGVLDRVLPSHKVSHWSAPEVYTEEEGPAYMNFFVESSNVGSHEPDEAMPVAEGSEKDFLGGGDTERVEFGDRSEEKKDGPEQGPEGSDLPEETIIPVTEGAGEEKPASEEEPAREDESTREEPAPEEESHTEEPAPEEETHEEEAAPEEESHEEEAAPEEESHEETEETSAAEEPSSEEG